MTQVTQEPIIDKLERLEREATPGEWGVNVEGPATWIDRADHAVTVGQTLRTPDAALIVAMRNALPALLSQLREQRELLRVNQDAHKKCDVLIDELGRQLAAAERTVREQREALERIMAIPHQLHHPNWSDMCAVCIALAALAPDTGGTNE